MPAAGELKRRFTIQRAVETPDEYGEKAITFVDVTDLWGALKPLQGRELFMAQAVNAQLSHRITLRYQRNLKLTPKDRLYLKAEARAFNIISVADVGDKHAEWEIMATEFFNA